MYRYGLRIQGRNSMWYVATVARWTWGTITRKGRVPPSSKFSMGKAELADAVGNGALFAAPPDQHIDL